MKVEHWIAVILVLVIVGIYSLNASQDRETETRRITVEHRDAVNTQRATCIAGGGRWAIGGQGPALCLPPRRARP